MPGKPHIIYLMADQLRADVLGTSGLNRLFSGKPPQLTPMLDRLAARSTWLDRHYTPCPLCVPARSSIATGLYTHQHGAIINGWLPHERDYGMIRPDLPLLPQALADAGYRSVHVGVQHVRCEPSFTARQSGVEFIGPTGASEHRAELEKRGLRLEDPAPYKDPVLDFDRGKPVITPGSNAQIGIFPLVEELYFDCQLADRMVDTIRNHRGGPLALLGMFWLPHPPLVAPRQWAELIDMTQLKLPATVGKWFSGTPALQLANFPGQLGAHISFPQWQQAWAVYLGMVGLLDKCVGRVLAALDHAGMLDDSIVIFTSDHGEMLGSHRLYQKMCCYEEAVRVPAIVKPPGTTYARRTMELTHHLDFTATMLDTAGITADAFPTAGKSLTELVTGRQQRLERQHVFASYDGNAGRGFRHRMVRSRSHKLIHNIGDVPELYDLIEDPRETINLARHPEHRPVFRELRAALNQWMHDVGDDQPHL
jgi:arylsulfatase A-like enzyme